MKYVWEWEMISKIYTVAENKCKKKKKSASGLLLHCFAQMVVQIQKCKH